MTRALVVAFAYALSACATAPRTPPEPIVQVREVKVPVAVPCPAVAALSRVPAYPDTDAALSSAPSLFERVKLLLAGRVLRVEREATIAGVAEACR